MSRHELARGRMGRYELARGKICRHELAIGKICRHELARGRMSRHELAIGRMCRPELANDTFFVLNNITFSDVDWGKKGVSRAHKEKCNHSNGNVSGNDCNRVFLRYDFWSDKTQKY